LTDKPLDTLTAFESIELPVSYLTSRSPSESIVADLLDCVSMVAT